MQDLRTVVWYNPEFLLNKQPEWCKSIIENIDEDAKKNKETTLFFFYAPNKSIESKKIQSSKENWNWIDDKSYTEMLEESKGESCTLYYWMDDTESEKQVQEYPKKYKNLCIKKIKKGKSNSCAFEIPDWAKKQKDTNYYYVEDNNGGWTSYYVGKDVLDDLNCMVKIKKPIFVIGERGSGKTSLIQTYIKEKLGLKDENKFVSVACGTLEPERAVSDLFGYVRGAFTGAAKNGHKGYVEQANGGCLYLDEVQDLSKEIQRKLLKCLQEHTFRKLGSEKEEKSNFLLVCSSNRPLSELKKLMYEDFYDRISTFQIKIKSIEEQKEEQKATGKSFIEKILPSVWNNYQKTASSKFYFRKYEDLDAWNDPSSPKPIQEKIISALEKKR